jgi:RNA polymerase sigma factor (TIGR02999 family)
MDVGGRGSYHCVRQPQLVAIMTEDPGIITALLAEWSEGDADAFPKLVALAYGDLRTIAHRRLLMRRDDDLATTALVHEAYLKLLGGRGGQWESRSQFYAFASHAMRHILVDHARREQAARRGGGAVRIPLEEGAVAASDEGAADVLAVEETLQRLASVQPRMARVVELRFFGGFTVSEVAEVLGMSPRSVEREWTRAKAYLLDAFRRDDLG